MHTGVQALVAAIIHLSVIVGPQTSRASDGDRSPAESGDKSPHSKGERPSAMGDKG
jgi:hypothetical protein